jgi:hypothetical protein
MWVRPSERVNQSIGFRVQEDATGPKRGANVRRIGAIRVKIRGALKSPVVLVPLMLFAMRSASGQTPAPAPPSEPPPRLEASAQFTFLDTRGNASAQSLGAGGEVIWRPDPWTYAAKATFAQNESDR